MKKEILTTIITIIGLIITGIFWIFTMNGIPQRVDKLEDDVKVLKTEITKNSVKTDIILDDVKTIKQVAISKGL